MGAFHLILTVAGLASEHGGPSRSLVALARELARLGVRVDLVTCEPSASQQKHVLAPRKLLTMHWLPTRCRQWQWHGRSNSFFGHIKTLCAGSVPTIIHDTGVWLPTNHACAQAARRLGVPLVLSPRGMLAPWSIKHHGLKKRLAWMIYQRRDLASLRLLHATSEMEAQQFRSLGLDKPIAVVPNGVELPGAEPGLGGDDLNRRTRFLLQKQTKETKTLLFLSRLHPKKGLLDLVAAWAELKPIGWRAVLAGADEAGHRAEVEAAVCRQRLGNCFEFVGEVADENKWDLYRRSDLFVLPSRSENFGLVIAEALACGVPVITTRATPWRDLVEHRCGWWIEGGVRPLVEALRQGMALSDSERGQMGARGRLLVESRYNWSRAAEEMKAAYEWLLGFGPRPVCVV